jgi:uncharacterized protein (DUF608 family)
MAGPKKEAVRKTGPAEVSHSVVIIQPCIEKASGSPKNRHIDVNRSLMAASLLYFVFFFLTHHREFLYWVYLLCQI